MNYGQQDKETDLIDKVITKVVKAPSKKQTGIFHRKKGVSYETR